MKRAKIIVIEGTDGSGKETQSKNIEKYLSDSDNINIFQKLFEALLLKWGL